MARPSDFERAETSKPVNGDLRVDVEMGGFAFNLEQGLFIPYEDNFVFEEPEVFIQYDDIEE